MDKRIRSAQNELRFDLNSSLDLSDPVNRGVVLFQTRPPKRALLGNAVFHN